MQWSCSTSWLIILKVMSDFMPNGVPLVCHTRMTVNNICVKKERTIYLSGYRHENSLAL